MGPYRKFQRRWEGLSMGLKTAGHYRERRAPKSSYGRAIRAIATSLLLSGCTNYLFVEKRFGPGDSERYRLGSVPWGRERDVEEELCGPRQFATKWASRLVAATVLTEQQAGNLVHNTCFRVNPHGPTRFEEQGQLSLLAESLTPDQVRALHNALKALDESYTVERLRGMTPEMKLFAVIFGVAVGGTAAALATTSGGSACNPPLCNPRPW